MGFDEIALRLTPEGRELLLAMVDRHVAARDAPFRHFLLSETSGGAHLLWAMGGKVLRTSQSTMSDLVELGLLRQGQRGHNRSFEVRADTVRFAQWLRSQGGPVGAVEREVQRLVDDEGFAAAHPDASHNLAEAQRLLWSDKPTAETSIVEIGSHLRSAVQSTVHDLAGGKTEDPIPNLTRWMTTVTGEREGKVLIDLVRHALSCCQRLTHIHDETEKTRPLRSLDELRRSVFVTSVVCYELAALATDAAAHT